MVLPPSPAKKSLFSSDERSKEMPSQIAKNHTPGKSLEQQRANHVGCESVVQPRTAPTWVFPHVSWLVPQSVHAAMHNPGRSQNGDCVIVRDPYWQLSDSRALVPSKSRLAFEGPLAGRADDRSGC